MSVRESLDLAMKVACDGNQPAEAREAAISSLPSLIGNRAILPTPGVGETKAIFDGQMQSYQSIRSGLASIVEDKNSPGPTKVRALEIKSHFDAFQEAIGEIAPEAAETPIPEGSGEGDDEGVAVHTNRFWFPFFGPSEEACCCMPVECCGCGVTIKEFRGLQLVWRPRLITRTIEPWTSRARIIRKVVWVLEWVPVETIKTISVTCERHGGHRTSVSQKVVRDSSLLTYWRNLQPCGHATH